MGTWVNKWFWGQFSFRSIMSLSVANVAMSWHISDRWTALWQDIREKKHFRILTKYHLRFLKSGCTMLIHQSPPYEGTINKIHYPESSPMMCPNPWSSWAVSSVGRQTGEKVVRLTLSPRERIVKNCFDIFVFHFHFLAFQKTYQGNNFVSDGHVCNTFCPVLIKLLDVWLKTL